MRSAALLLAGLGSGCAVLDAQPPVLLSSELPEGPLRRSLELTLEVHDARPGLHTVELRVDEGAWQGLHPEGAALTHELDLRSLSDGPHVLELRAIDASWRRNPAQVEHHIVVDNTPPTLSLVEALPELAQGRSTALLVRSDPDTVRIEGLLAERRHRFHAVGDGVFRALVGTAIRQPPGSVELGLEAEDEAGNTSQLQVELQVQPVEYRAGGFIRLSAAQRQARGDETAKAEMRAERDAAYAHVEPEQLFDGPMVMPTEGRESSPFGKYRRYSDGKRSYHSGLDLTNRRGTPVLAGADGVVLVAGWQHIFGNVVIVHHGQGVSTSYNHLQAVEVEVGDRVQAGQRLGAMGSTGQSTGPHLHWGLVVGGEAVDPRQWLEQDMGALRPSEGDP